MYDNSNSQACIDSNMSMFLFPYRYACAVCSKSDSDRVQHGTYDVKKVGTKKFSAIMKYDESKDLAFVIPVCWPTGTKQRD